MRIDANLAASMSVENESRKAKVGNRVGLDSASADDSASLTVDAASFNALREQISGMPDVRQERVGALRLAAQNGTYASDPSSTAAAMLSEFGGWAPMVN